VVTRNIAGRQGGGIINGGALTLRGGRVTFNQAAQEGGGIFTDPVRLPISVRFTVVAFNTPDNCFPQDTIRGCRH
jgi:hypothetical protein